MKIDVAAAGLIPARWLSVAYESPNKAAIGIAMPVVINDATVAPFAVDPRCCDVFFGCSTATAR